MGFEIGQLQEELRSWGDGTIRLFPTWLIIRAHLVPYWARNTIKHGIDCTCSCGRVDECKAHRFAETAASGHVHKCGKLTWGARPYLLEKKSMKSLSLFFTAVAIQTH